MKWAGLIIANPTSVAEATNYEVSILLICFHILATFGGDDVFRSAKHKSVIVEVKRELKLRHLGKYDIELN